MTGKEFSRKVRESKLYEKAKKTLCGFSDGSIFIDGDLDKLEGDAKAQSVEIFILKDNRTKKTKPETVTE